MTKRKEKFKEKVELREKTEQPKANETGKKKILVVDDSYDLRVLMEKKLTDAGFSVVTAEDGEQAIEQVEKAHPNLILLDVNMPKLDGYQVCSILKGNAVHKEIPIIFLTARSDQVDEFRAWERHADDYITKPFDPELLLTKIHLFLKD